MIVLTWFGASALMLAWVAVVDCIRRNRSGPSRSLTAGSPFATIPPPAKPVISSSRGSD